MFYGGIQFVQSSLRVCEVPFGVLGHHLISLTWKKQAIFLSFEPNNNVFCIQVLLVYSSLTNNSNSYKIFWLYKSTHSHTNPHRQIHKQAETNRLKNKAQTHTSIWHVSIYGYLSWLNSSNCTITVFPVLYKHLFNCL